ncbi:MULTISPECIES: hypothetical protein [unclassified Enterobacter]|jgi:hypothetical protein|nr:MULTISPECIES: hypothetical protein [unclassified Enterobacter]WJD48406.1 hypothetical protein QRD42_14030 [Enterobacter sp. PGRG2]
MTTQTQPPHITAAEPQRPVKDNPAKQGELPRKRDDSQDDSKDPFKAS